MKKKLLLGGLALGFGVATAGVIGYWVVDSQAKKKKKKLGEGKKVKGKRIEEEEEEEEEIKGDNQDGKQKLRKKQRVKIPDGWRKYRFPKGGFTIYYPPGWCSIEKPQEKIPLMTIHFVNPKKALHGKSQTFVSIESQRILPSNEEYLRRSLEIVAGAGKISNYSKCKKMINGHEFTGVEFSVIYEAVREELYVYCMCAGLHHRNFLFQQLSSEGPVDKELCESMLQTIEIEPIGDIGELFFNGYGFYIQFPTINFEQLEIFEPNNILFYGEKSSEDDEKMSRYIKLNEEKDVSCIEELEERCRMEISAFSTTTKKKKKEEEEVEGEEEDEEGGMMGLKEERFSIATRETVRFIYPSKDGKGAYFVVPFEVKIESKSSFYRLEYYIDECNNFEKTRILNSIDSIDFDSSKRMEKPRLQYYNAEHRFGLRYVPHEYCCFENTHDEPIIIFNKPGLEKMLELDVCKKPMIEKIVSLEELKREVLKSINPQDLISSEFVKINNQDFLQIRYSEIADQFGGKVLYFFQSVTCIKEDFFYLRTTSEGTDFNESELEEAKQIHSSLHFR